MPTLDKNERQRLRAVQQNLLQQCLSAGAEYIQMSTVGVIYHPQINEPVYNVVIPHHGVAWTRSQDIEDAFVYLNDHSRQPKFQFLQTLFPEAFKRQLEIKGLVPEEDWQIWLFEPFYGPSLPDELLFGQPVTKPLVDHVKIVPVTTDNQRQQWRELSGQPDVPVPVKNCLWLAVNKQTPIGAGRVMIQDETAHIDTPTVAPNWSGFGIEDALLQVCVEKALEEEAQLIYAVDNASTDANYPRLGFTKFTRLLTYRANSRIPLTRAGNN
ncbi:MAG: GNAT family N-acetyltransferase [Chloroflexi bacterium]|nr:GNAT family N-acetyltransferase [Chloroflexota bacterium]